MIMIMYIVTNENAWQTYMRAILYEAQAISQYDFTSRFSFLIVSFGVSRDTPLVIDILGV